MEHIRWPSGRDVVAAATTVAALRAAAFAASAGPADGIPCRYDLTIIQNPFDCGDVGSTNTVAITSTDGGVVAGHTTPCIPLTDKPFVWSETSGFQVLSMPGVSSAQVTGISERGDVVGVADFPGAYMGFLRKPGGELIQLFPARGGTNSWAYAVRDDGLVAGHWGNTATGPSPLACLWSEGRITDLSPMIGTPTSEAMALSSNGLIAGWGATAWTLDARAFVMNGDVVKWLPPLPGGFTSEAWSVNDQGHVAGHGRMDNPLGGSPIWRAYAWIDGIALNLGALPGEVKSTAYGINRHNTIVGTSEGRAFAWHAGAMVDLNDLVDHEIELEIGIARDIRDDGVITASGAIFTPIGHPVGFLLTPVYFSPADFTGDCQVNGKDLAVLLQSWGRVAVTTSAADLNHDGVVNGVDLAMLLGMWG